MNLTPAQEAAIRYAKTSRIGFELYIEPDDVTRQATVDALVKKGLVQAGRGVGVPYWLTDAGIAEHKRLTAPGPNDCPGCGYTNRPGFSECAACREVFD